ncbi:nitrate/nitrite transporter NrtS [Flavobacteriales bacterium]|jgi:hypothetical protein|nr:nitrate/nitrite transporter NrtS [Flavobacteriales bacterium]
MSFFHYAKKKEIVIRSIKVALVVGTVLGPINHSNAILNGTLDSTRMFQMGLTYCVPYLVATYGAASQAAQSSKNKEA